MNKLKRKMITRSESEIVKSADICFASSKILQKRLEIIGGKKVTVIENGVDYQHFNRLSTEAPTSNVSQTLGFIGGLKPWKIDFKLLLELGAVRTDWHLVIVGPFYGERNSVFNELIQQSNVTHLGEVSYNQAPEVIRTFDVGLLPYLENEYNQGVFPLKLYEYLACGKPVVGCGLPSTVHCQSEGVYEHVKNDLEAFAAACDRAIRMAN